MAGRTFTTRDVCEFCGRPVAEDEPGRVVAHAQMKTYTLSRAEEINGPDVAFHSTCWRIAGSCYVPSE
jgi:hypothetical protein